MKRICEKKGLPKQSFVLWCFRQDLNLHPYGPDPKSGVSANSTTGAGEAGIEKPEISSSQRFAPSGCCLFYHMEGAVVNVVGGSLWRKLRAARRRIDCH